MYSSINIIKINTKHEMLRIIIISEARLSKGDIRAKRLVSTGFFWPFLAILDDRDAEDNKLQESKKKIRLFKVS